MKMIKRLSHKDNNSTLTEKKKTKASHSSPPKKKLSKTKKLPYILKNLLFASLVSQLDY